MNAEELIAELYKADSVDPAHLWELRVRIAQRYLLNAYSKGRWESMELSDNFSYERNVKTFVAKVMKQ